MLQMRNIVAVFIGLIVVTACNSYSISENKEPVFKNFKPEEAVYKNKLAEMIQSNPDDLTYIFEKYIDAEHIEIMVSGTDFLATGLIQVNDWTGIEGVKEAKGGGYRGAELSGLQLDIVDKPSGAELIYKSIDYIID